MRAYKLFSGLNLASTGYSTVLNFDPSTIESSAAPSSIPAPFQAGNNAVLALVFCDYSDATHLLVLYYETNDNPAGALTDGLPSNTDTNWVIQGTVVAATETASTEGVAWNLVADGGATTSTYFTMFVDLAYIGEFVQFRVETAAETTGTLNAYYLSN